MASIIGVNEIQHTNGTSAATVGTDGVMTLTAGTIGKVGTKQTLSGNSSVEFTGIPSDVSAIEFSLVDVSDSSSSGLLGWELGTSGGYVQSGYDCVNPYASSSVGGTTAGTKTSFEIFNFGNPGNSFTGTLRIVNHGSDEWVANGQFHSTLGPYILWLVGHKDLGDTLTKIKFKTSSSTFDAGSITMNYIR